MELLELILSIILILLTLLNNDLTNMFETYEFGKVNISVVGQTIITLEMPTKEGYKPILLGIAFNTTRDITSQGCSYNKTLGWRAFLYSNYNGTTSGTLIGVIAWIPE